ncbi:unnamed protein product [Trichobilharzia szidati]|nr:unnamed protein product [Trichobilharzia szidati]
MGAEQSVVGHQKSSSIQQNLHTTVLSPTSSSHSKSTKQTGHSSSVPSSPHYDWRRQSLTGSVVNNTLLQSTNSNSQLIPSNRQQCHQKQQQQQRTSLSSLSRDVLLSQSSVLFPSTASIVEPRLNQSHRSLSTKSLNYSLDKSTGTSTSHKHSTGILVVNRGRYASSQYELSTCGDVNSGNNNSSSSANNYTDIGISQLKKLQRISTFEPLISVNNSGGGVGVKTSSSSHSTATTNQQTSGSSSSVNSHASTGFRKKQFIPNIPEFECDELIQLSLTYEEYLHKYATDVSQKQSDIIIIQNKIDRDVCQLSETLEAREKGIISAAVVKTNPTASESNSSRKQKLAGSQQIETIVLLTSQISGLMSQCDELCKHLMSAINNLNETLSNYESN